MEVEVDERAVAVDLAERGQRAGLFRGNDFGVRSNNSDFDLDGSFNAGSAQRVTE